MTLEEVVTEFQDHCRDSMLKLEQSIGSDNPTLVASALAGAFASALILYSESKQ